MRPRPFAGSHCGATGIGRQPGPRSCPEEGSQKPASRAESGWSLCLYRRGGFLIGSTSDDAIPNEQVVNRVRISNEFHVGNQEVTQGQWRAVMGSNPSHFSNGGTDCPIETVSLDDVREFVQRLNAIAGGHGLSPANGGGAEVRGAGGTTVDRYSAHLDAIAWWQPNTLNHTNLVGQKQANLFGRHDVFGNVTQSVHNVGAHSYPGGTVTIPNGPDASLTRVLSGRLEDGSPRRQQATGLLLDRPSQPRQVNRPPSSEISRTRHMTLNLTMCQAKSRPHHGLGSRRTRMLFPFLPELHRTAGSPRALLWQPQRWLHALRPRLGYFSALLFIATGAAQEPLSLRAATCTLPTLGTTESGGSTPGRE